MKRLWLALALGCCALHPAWAQSTAAQVLPGYLSAPGTNGCAGTIGSTTQPYCWVPYGASVPVTPPVTTYEGWITLAATTNTALTSGNVTMITGSLPAAGSFSRIVFIPPSSCAVTISPTGATISATYGGEPIGSGTNVGTDTFNLAGNANAPTLYSSAGCSHIYFRN